jgi:hypothetical protein
MLESTDLGQHAVYSSKKGEEFLGQLKNYQLTNSVLLSWYSQLSLITLSTAYIAFNSVTL